MVQQMKQQQSQQAHQQQLWQQQQQHQVAAMAAVAPFKLSAEREPVFESGSAGQAGAHPPGTAWGNIGPQRAQQQQQQADSSRAKYAVYKAGAAETVLVVGDEEEELPEESFDELQVGCRLTQDGSMFDQGLTRPDLTHRQPHARLWFLCGLVWLS